MEVGLAILVLVVLVAIWLQLRNGDTPRESSGAVGAGSTRRGIANPRQRLKEATRLKKEGKLDEAAEFLRKLVAKWEGDPPISRANVPEDYPEVKVYWKLANYLQRAGRSEEAWEVLRRVHQEQYPKIQQAKHYFQRLAEEGPEYDGEYARRQVDELLESEPENTIYLEKSQIYDKTRLFLHREGRDLEALKYGIMADALGLLSLWYGSRNEPMVQEQYEKQTEEGAVREAVARRAKKANRPELEQSLGDLVVNWVQRIPDVDPVKLQDGISRLLESFDR